MQAALDAKEKGETLETPEPGSVADVMSKNIVPVISPRFSLSNHFCTFVLILIFYFFLKD